MARILALAAAAALLLVLLWKTSDFLLGDPAVPGTPGRAVVEAAADPSAPVLEGGPAADQAAEERVQIDPVSPGESRGSDPNATTGALVIRAVLSDEQPLPLVGVVVDPRADGLGRGVRRVVTDAEGLARVDDLPLGEVSLWSHHGARARAEVVAGEEREVRLEFRSGVHVQGVVVDAQSSPVAGADVWLAAWRRDWLGTTLVAKSAADGSFDIPHVRSDRSLGATAPGHGPSDLIDLSITDVSQPPVQLRLELKSAGGDLQGRVLNSVGRPVSGARVAVGKEPPDYSMRHDGTEEEQWTARVATTQADGSYRLSGLATGTLPVHVLARGFPILRSDVEILEGDTVTLELQLERGLRVVGVVHDESGVPVEEAIVLALDVPFDDPFPTQGPTDRGVPFRRPGIRTGIDGSFALEWMPPGDVHLYTSKGTSYWDSREDEFLGMVQETLSGEPGETLTWEPVLTRGRRIHGQVFYANGEPMGNVFVSATDPANERKRYTEYADEDGRFSIPGLENQAYTVSVQLWDAPDDAKPLEQEEVWPSETELQLFASFSENTEAKGTVRVRVDDEADRITGRGMVMMEYDGGAYYTEEADGVHEVRLPPGRYRPLIYSGDVAVGSGDWFDLAPSEVLDLGTIKTSPAGSLVVHVVRGIDTAPGPVWLVLDSQCARHSDRIKLEPGQDSATFENLCAGAGVLRLEGVRVADIRRPITIDADLPTELTLETIPAVLQPLELTAAEPSGWGRLELVVTDEQGALYNEFETRERWAGDLPVQTSFRLPIGVFRVEAKTTSGLSFEGEIEVESLKERETWSCRLE